MRGDASVIVAMLVSLKILKLANPRITKVQIQEKNRLNRLPGGHPTEATASMGRRKMRVGAVIARIDRTESEAEAGRASRAAVGSDQDHPEAK